MALLIIGLIIMGFTMSNMDNSLKPTIYGLHKSFGITVLGLALLRLLLRIFTKVPPMPKNSNIFLNYISRFTHWGLYCFMFIMPLSGYVMSSASQRSFKWFFNIDVPLLIDQNTEIAQNAHNAHINAPYVLIALIGLHLLGTLKHLIINKENIVKRIW